MSREDLGLVARARTADAVRAALETLAADGHEVRQAVLDRLARISADPRRLDSDCAIRTVLLAALRPLALPEDIDLLEAATLTYEFGSLGELACNLRAAGLLALAEADQQLAEFHAVRLLADRFTAAGSREPALSAVRLLQAQGHELSLLQHLLEGRPAGEEAAECFRALSTAPAPVLLHLAERWAASEDEVALLGLFDALLGHPRPDRFGDHLERFLEESPQLDLVRYLAAAIVAGRDDVLIGVLRDRSGLPGARGEAVREALALLPAG